MSASGSRYPFSDRPATAGNVATASSCASRVTALFTPEAMPEWRSSAAASSVAVIGATTVAEAGRGGQHADMLSGRDWRATGAGARTLGTRCPSGRPLDATIVRVGIAGRRRC